MPDEVDVHSELQRIREGLLAFLMFRFKLQRADAEDVVGDTIEIVLKRSVLIKIDDVKAYAYQVARRLASARVFYMRALPDDLINGAPTPDEALCQSEDCQRLRSCIAKLPRALRLIVRAVLRSITQVKIAERLRRSKADVNRKLAFAKKQLLECIANPWTDGGQP